MAVHHDKLMDFLRKHSDETMTSTKGNPRSPINWGTVGRDPKSIAGAFKFLADEIESGTFD